MAIEMTDPYGGDQPVELGQSKLPIRETYSASPRGIHANYEDAMHNAAQVFNAVKELSGTFKEQAQKEQAINDQAAGMTAEYQMAGGALTAAGSPGNVVASLFGGKGGGTPDGVTAPSTGSNPFGMFGGGVSPGKSAVISHTLGGTAAENMATQDPTLQKLLTSPETMSNPTAFTQAWNGRAKEIADSAPVPAGMNPMIYRSGLYSQLMQTGRGWAGKAQENAIKNDRQTLYNGAETYLNSGELPPAPPGPGSSTSIGGSDTQNKVFNIVRQMGVDPAKAFQVVGVESNWNDTAVNQYGAGGLFQITPARLTDIKAHMEADGQGALASQITNRLNPEQAAMAWAYEFKRNEGAAKQILGRDPSTAETYMYWQSEKYAPAILSHPNMSVRDAMMTAPNATAEQVDKIIAANPSIYHGGDASVAQTVDHLNRYMNSTSKLHTEYPRVDVSQRETYTRQNWNDGLSKYYKFSDFVKNRDPDGVIDNRIVHAADALSSFMGRKVEINSGYRSDEDNRVASLNAGGSGTSKNHQTGDSVDFNITDPKEQLKAAEFLASIGVRGIGIGNGNNHLHVDFATGRPTQQERTRGFLEGDSAISKAELNDAIARGSARADTGQNYVRDPARNGQPMNPVEKDIQVLRDRFGIPYVQGKAMAFDAAISKAKNKAFNNNPTGAMEDLTHFQEAYGRTTPDEELKLNEARKAVLSLGEAKYRQQKVNDEMAASDWFQQELAKIKQASIAGKSYAPDPRSAPTTEAGNTAASQIAAIAANPLKVPESVNGLNVQIATNKIDGDQQQFLSGLGISKPAGQATMDEIVHGLMTKEPGKYSLDGATAVAKHYEDVRQNAPKAQGVADEMYKLHEIDVYSTFVQNTPNLQQAVTQANQNDKDSGGYGASESFRAKDEMGIYKKVHDDVFRKSVMDLTHSALMDNNGVPLSGEQKTAIAEQALQKTALFDKTMDAIVASHGGNLTESLRYLTQMRNPQAAYDQRNEFSKVRANLAKDGYVATDVRQMPGVPTNSYVMVNPVPTAEDLKGKTPEQIKAIQAQTGQPQMVDGAYKLMTPNGQVMYYKPEYNVMPPQGAAQPTQAPAELQAAPEPEAPKPPTAEAPANAQAPAWVQHAMEHPMFKDFAKDLGNIKDWAKSQPPLSPQQVQKFMRFMGQSATEQMKQGGPPVTP